MTPRRERTATERNGQAFHSSYVNAELHLSGTLFALGIGAASLIGLLSGLAPALLFNRPS